jgi:ribosomal protein S18 acetylase RimI-like enzyme
MQFQAQHRFYMEQFADAEFSVVRWRGRDVGRLYLHRRADELRLIDIALLPEVRRQGLGGALMRRILSMGQEAGKPVRIHVEKNNPALRLYHRLGFENVEDQGVYYLMQWTPEAP